MNKDEILMKAQNGEGLTVEEIKVYQNIVKPVKHVLRQIRNTCQNLFCKSIMSESIGRSAAIFPIIFTE